METTPPSNSSRLWPAQLAALALIWGSSFLLIKLGLEAYEPLQVSAGRIVVGALTLVLVLAVTRERLPGPGRIWVHASIIGMLMNVIPFSLFAWGETRMGSIEAGIWNATTPLMAAVAAYLIFRTDRASVRSIAGLVIGFLGVLLVLAPWQGLGGGVLAGHLAFAAGAACYGLGTPYMRRHFGDRPESPVALSATQLLCASVVIVVASALVDGAPPTDVELVPAASVIALGAFGTGIAYVLFASIIRASGATVAASVTYLMPIVSTTLGALVLAEQIGWNDAAGAAVILCGVWLSSQGAPARAARPAAR